MLPLLLLPVPLLPYRYSPGPNDKTWILIERPKKTAMSEISTHRSSGKLKTIVVENTKDEMGNWIPFHVSIGSWVTLHPSRNQIWATKRRKLDDIKSHWKGVVKAFKRRERGEKVEKVLIAHVYERKDILKDYVAQQNKFPQIGLNCFCVSNFEEWQPVESITSILNAFHSQIGEILYEGKDSKSLREEGVWFYKYEYFLPSSKMVGYIEEAKLPTLREIGLPNSTPTLIDCIRSKSVLEIQSGMQEKGGACDHFSMHLPFFVFAEVFKEEDSIRMTKMMYVCTDPSNKFLCNLFYSGWDTRIHLENGEQLKCMLSVETLRFRYSIKRKTLYVSFKFRRFRRIRDNRKWIWMPIEQDNNDDTHSPLISIDVFKDGVHFKTLSMEENWSLFEVRRHIEFEE